METVCLELSLRLYLHAVQSGHLMLRKLLVTFIESNKGMFKGLCDGTLQSHCARMRKPSTFGTQAELQAAASLFQLCVYVYHKCSEERGWEWMKYKPYSREKLNYSAINIPEVPESFHIEIFYNDAGAHFDLIVPMNPHNILTPPPLPEAHTTLSIDLS